MIGNVGSARPDYYDRNPAQTDISYSGAGIAPHGTTNRGGYTVPTGKKAYFEAAAAWFRRITVGAPVNYYAAFCTITRSGGSVRQLVIVDSVDNTVNFSKFANLASIGMLVAGDAANIWSSDASTGGTVSFELLIKFTQFDA